MTSIKFSAISSDQATSDLLWSAAKMCEKNWKILRFHVMQHWLDTSLEHRADSPIFVWCLSYYNFKLSSDFCHYQVIIFLPGSGSGLGGGGGLAKDVSFWWKPKRFYFDWYAFNCGPEIAESFSFSSESSEWTLGVPGGGKDGLASVLQHFLRPLPFRAFKWRAFGAWKLIPSTVL